jgi:hypothetical protein
MHVTCGWFANGVTRKELHHAKLEIWVISLNERYRSREYENEFSGARQPCKRLRNVLKIMIRSGFIVQRIIPLMSTLISMLGHCWRLNLPKGKM